MQAALENNRLCAQYTLDDGTKLYSALKPSGGSPYGLDEMGKTYSLIQIGQKVLEDHEIVAPSPEPDAEPFVYFDAMRQELCLQLRAEKNWHLLVQTMAPSCVPSDAVFDALERLIEGAIGRISGISCDAEFRPRIPPHYETSLDSLVDDIDRRGIGRKS